MIFSGLALLILVAEKLFGGGNALANKFRTLEKDTAAELTALRLELNRKVDEYEGVSTVGFETVKNSIHQMQIGLLEFRATMAENLHAYIRKNDYNAGVADIKRDVQSGFRSMDERMGQLQDLLMYVNPDAKPPGRTGERNK